MVDLRQMVSFAAKEAGPVESRQLSPRESQIVELAMEGFTNESIANELGLSVGTVNTYWQRIRLKVGGLGRTDTVAKIIRDRAEHAIHDYDAEQETLRHIIDEKDHSLTEVRNSLWLLQAALNEIETVVWSTDRNLVLSSVVNGEVTAKHCGISWDAARSIYDVFGKTEAKERVIAAHLDALKGNRPSLILTGPCCKLALRTLPLRDGSNEIVGSIGILHYIGRR